MLVRLGECSADLLRESLLDAWLVHAPCRLARVYLDGGESDRS